MRILIFDGDKNIKYIESIDYWKDAVPEFKKIHAGNFGLSGCFSFYPTKQITTGEGGALVTNDKKIYERAKLFSKLSREITVAA
mgnify:CR=1 FL=1